MRKKISCLFFIFALFILASTSFAGILEKLNHGADRNDYHAFDNSWIVTSSGHWDYWDTFFHVKGTYKHRDGDHDYDHDGDHGHDYDHDGDHDHDYDHDGDHNGDTPPVAPEPAGSVLFLTGSAVFAYRRFMKRG
jgi:ABC-type nickel/cobalt efflux system permease component RcnA